MSSNFLNLQQDHSQDKGFTLIELLVVIAIIGILAAVILASLNTAREKGDDAAIQSDLSNVRTEAEIYYDQHGNYGAGTPNGVNCGTTFTANTMLTDQTIENALAQAYTDANGSGLSSHLQPFCNISSSGAAYALAFPLRSINSTTGVQGIWCIDSTGAARSGLDDGTPYDSTIDGTVAAFNSPSQYKCNY